MCEYKDILLHVFSCLRSARRHLIWPQMLQTTTEMKEILDFLLHRSYMETADCGDSTGPTAVTDGHGSLLSFLCSEPASPASQMAVAH